MIHSLNHSHSLTHSHSITRTRRLTHFQSLVRSLTRSLARSLAHQPTHTLEYSQIDKLLSLRIKCNTESYQKQFRLMEVKAKFSLTVSFHLSGLTKIVLLQEALLGATFQFHENLPVIKQNIDFFIYI
jgi:hypothetical protein